MKNEGKNSPSGMRTRREIADGVMARICERGLVMDKDRDFMNLINEWTAGLIEMPECRQRYLAVLCRRKQDRRAERRFALETNTPETAGGLGVSPRIAISWISEDAVMKRMPLNPVLQPVDMDRSVALIPRL
jgi:hypothetical protein